MMKKSAWLLALALSVVELQACSSEPAKLDLNIQPSPQNQTTSQPSLQSTPAQEIVVATPAKFKEVLTGAMDGKLAVRMELEREGSKLTGSYYYDRPGAFNLADKILELSGRVDNDGNATLAEILQNYDTGGSQKTGEFKGKLDAVSVNGDTRLKFSGVWTSAKDKKQLPFILQSLRHDLGGLKLEEKKQVDANKKLRYEIEMVLPQLAVEGGAGGDPARAEKFNKTAAAFVAGRTREFKKAVGEMAREDAAAAKSAKETPPPEPSPQSSMDVSYEVTTANKDFISILFYFSEYSGGAHPNTTTLSFTYDLNRNSGVNLSDLFTPGSNYLQVISDYTVKGLNKVKTVSDAESGAGPKLENFHSWNITPAGLKITFDRYQVAGYAAGDHEVVIPYSVLKPIIKPDGLLAQYEK